VSPAATTIANIFVHLGIQRVRRSSVACAAFSWMKANRSRCQGSKDKLACWPGKWWAEART